MDHQNLNWPWCGVLTSSLILAKRKLIYIHTCFDVECDLTLRSFVADLKTVEMFLLWLPRVKHKNGELASDHVKSAAESRSTIDPLRWSLGKLLGAAVRGSWCVRLKEHQADRYSPQHTLLPISECLLGSHRAVSRAQLNSRLTAAL